MICSIHDVAYPEGETCWCCSLEKHEEILVRPPHPLDSTAARMDAPLPPRELTPSGNLHCGKHDTIYTAETPCRGCEMELASSSGQDSPSASSSTVKIDAKILGPDDTLAELRGVPIEETRKTSWPGWMSGAWARMK